MARLTALVALWLSASLAHAQYQFDHWTADNGLPQNGVRAIVQTRDGYLWLTTFDGLVRFDGVRFTVFDKSNTPGIPGNRFFGLVEDRDGDLWASLETGEVVRRHDGRFETFTRDHGLTGEIAPWLARDEQGNAVVFYSRSAPAAAASRLLRLEIEAYRWSEGNFRRAEDLDAGVATDRLGAVPVNTFLYGAGGGLWWVMRDSLLRFATDGSVRIYDAASGLHGTQPGLVRDAEGRWQAVTVDAAGMLWITDLESMRRRALGAQMPEGFEVWSGYADREGNYWFATNHNGLFRARPQTVTPYDAAHGLDAREVYPLLERRDGSLWIGTNHDGLYELKDGSLTRHSVTDDLVATGAGSLYEDRAGRLWVNGVYQFVDGRFVEAPWLDRLPVSSRYDTAWTMCEDRAGAYWIGRGSGVVRYQNGEVTHYTTKDGLAGDDTKVIIEDGAGGLWLGSYGGLTHYRDGKFTAWTERDGLPGSTVRALRVDGDGTLWIGTYDSGLGRLKDGRFTSYTTKKGLFDNGAFQILEDDAGWLWMSSNRGIYRVRKQELVDVAEGRVKALTCVAYNKSDGMPSSECNGGRWPAGVRTRDGRLWFPTMGGVATIDPANVRPSTEPPPVVIEGMRIDNEPASDDAWSAALRDPRSAVEVLPGQDNFEITYTALSFVNSENMRFKYMLEGADSDWVDAGTRRTAYFSRVAPGDYTFRVIAANSDGVWNEAGASVHITVVPPFWRTWWFLALVGLAAAAALTGAWRYRVGQLERVQAAQQEFARQLIASQEAERKRIAGELHDSLGQNLLVIKNRALLGALQVADELARAQFQELSGAVSQTLAEVRAISRDLRPPHLDHLGLRTALVAMIEKVASSSNIAFTQALGELDGHFPPGDDIMLYRIVQECLNNVLKHSGATEVKISAAVSDSLFVLTIGDNGRGLARHDGPSGTAGMGLQYIAERVRILGGEHTIHSAPDRGTVVTVTIDLNHPQRRVMPR